MRAHDDDDIIASRQIVLHQAEALAQQPFDPIAARRVADALADGQADAGMLEIGWDGKCSQGTPGLLDAAIKHRREIDAAAYAMRLGEGVTSFGHDLVFPE